MSSYDAIVVGAGHNGLVAAAYLARAGRRTLVCERRPFVGGACATEELFPGYRMSSCAGVLGMIPARIHNELALDEHGLRYHRLDPYITNLYPDRSVLTVWQDVEATQRSIAALSAADAASFPAWNDFWARAGRLVREYFLTAPPSPAELADFARAIGEAETLETLLTVPLGELVERFFEDERVRAAVVGLEDLGDPSVAGTAWTEARSQMIADSVTSEAFVEGGMGGVSEAIAAAARAAGAEIRLDAPVQEIVVADGRVTGVRLASGEQLHAPLVLSNADPKRTFRQLLAPEVVPDQTRAEVERLRTDVAYLRFHSIARELPDLSEYLGRQATPREVAHIQIGPSLGHFRRAYEDARAGRPAREPIVYLQVPTVYDPGLNSGPGYVVSAFVRYAPPRLASGSWDAARDSVGEDLIEYITQYIPNFRSSLEQWLLYTPWDLEQRLGLTDGNIRHLDMSPDQVGSGRSISASPYGTPVAGLFLCGSGTHPGGDVTGAPGHNAAHAAMEAAA